MHLNPHSLFDPCWWTAVMHSSFFFFFLVPFFACKNSSVSILPQTLSWQCGVAKPQRLPLSSGLSHHQSPADNSRPLLPQGGLVKWRHSCETWPFPFAACFIRYLPPSFYWASIRQEWVGHSPKGKRRQHPFSLVNCKSSDEERANES